MPASLFGLYASMPDIQVTAPNSLVFNPLVFAALLQDLIFINAASDRLRPKVSTSHEAVFT